MGVAERRQYKRMFFSIEEGPLGVFALPDMDTGVLTAIIMDLSMGGLGLSIRKGGDMSINVGDRLILTEIRGMADTNLRPINNIETEIKWIQNYRAFRHILFGCEFVDITQTTRDQIQQFINSWVEDADVRR